MNKIANKTLSFVSLWAKIEIMAALVISIIILGYAVFPENNQTQTQLNNEVSSTVEP